MYNTKQSHNFFNNLRANEQDQYRRQKLNMMVGLILIVVFVAAITMNGCSAFSTTSATTTLPPPSATTTGLQMGLFDGIFGGGDPELKAKKERQKQAKIREQERLQKEILDRRRNPEKMEEYEIKTQQRRELRMKGDDEQALKVAAEIFADTDEQTSLDGK